MPERIIGEYGSRRISSFHNIEGGTHAKGRDTGSFEMASDQTHGLMAHRSQWYEKCEVDVLRLKPFDNTRCQLLAGPALGINSSHAGEQFVCHLANDALSLKSCKRFDREYSERVLTRRGHV